MFELKDCVAQAKIFFLKFFFRDLFIAVNVIFEVVTQLRTRVSVSCYIRLNTTLSLSLSHTHTHTRTRARSYVIYHIFR